MRLGENNEDEGANDEGAEQVEEEAEVRFEAEDAGRDPKEGCAQVADVGNDLCVFVYF